MLQNAHGTLSTLIQLFEKFGTELPTKYYSTITLCVFFFNIACIVAFFILKSFSIYKMAKNNNLKCKWMAFVPFLNFCLIGKLAGKVRIFGVTFANIGIVFASVFAVFFALNCFFDIFYAADEFYRLVTFNRFEEIQWNPSRFINILSVIYYISLFASVFFLFFMSYAFLSKMDRAHMLLYTVFIAVALLLSSNVEVFVPVFAVVVFSVRNNKPFDIVEYYRKRNEAIVKMQQKYVQTNPFDEYPSENQGGSALNQDVFTDYSSSSSQSSSADNSNGQSQKADDDSANKTNSNNNDNNNSHDDSNDDDLFN